MMDCNNCGTNIKENVKFCPECGEKTNKSEHTLKEQVCPSCGTRLKHGTKKCPDCGEEINTFDHHSEEQTCQSCGTKVKKGTKSCPDCGTQFEHSPKVEILNPKEQQSLDHEHHMRRAKCPACGSTQIQVVPKTETTGFSTGKGCCGAVLLGPLGLLCGLLGSGKGKTDVVRVCLECGNEF